MDPDQTFTVAGNYVFLWQLNGIVTTESKEDQSDLIGGGLNFKILKLGEKEIRVSVINSIF